ncbi:MAG: CBS domain-containing protein [Deltaproteobacteria bacterium]|nr:MAG: CBS domain-containing protein [Deltaproteobacteria bacterium]
MFGHSFKLFNLFGFEVSIDLSWIFIAVLVTWSLAAGFFPYLYPHLPAKTYWVMGVIGSLGLFLSVIFHEFSHSVVARRLGLPMKGITLFIFGGVAQMGDEPASAKVEFFMAIAGPISSLVLGGIFYLLYVQGAAAGWSLPVNGVIRYLAYINVVLAVFNLLPAFPLDGGRVLRSILWGAWDDLRRATRVSAAVGSAFGFGLIALGILQLISGNFIAGLWWFLIGMFIRGAAQMSYQQLLVRNALAGEPVRNFMHPHPVTAPGSITLEHLVKDYIYKYHFKMFPVMDNSHLLGCITTRQVKEVPRERWSQETIRELVSPCSEENTISPETDAVQALALINRTGNSRLLVVEGNQLVGILTLRDLMKFLSLKVELEQ